MRYEIISAIKEIYTFSTSRVPPYPKLKIGDDFSILSAFQFASPPSNRSADIATFPLHLASYRGGNRLMYLQQPIPIVIPGYDLRLRRFDCQISSPFAFAYTLKCCRAPEITHRWDFYGAFSFPVENS